MCFCLRKENKISISNECRVFFFFLLIIWNEKYYGNSFEANSNNNPTSLSYYGPLFGKCLFYVNFLHRFDIALS